MKLKMKNTTTILAMDIRTMVTSVDDAAVDDVLVVVFDVVFVDLVTYQTKMKE